ncbi:MAG: DUF111 family protein, partial [Verrucomicrobia bacterium]|nr:DUF111 family protein [Verrucomicrobiota bacterium]
MSLYPYLLFCESVLIASISHLIIPPTHLHLDCPSGISGDMFAAARLDFGVPLPLFQSAVTALGLKETVVLKSERGLRGGLAGTR